ncbi:hypothetical protein Aduo_009630 [Ancylostoma duodenale]
MPPCSVRGEKEASNTRQEAVLFLSSKLSEALPHELCILQKDAIIMQSVHYRRRSGDVWKPFADGKLLQLAESVPACQKAFDRSNQPPAKKTRKD